MNIHKPELLLLLLVCTYKDRSERRQLLHAPR